MVREAKKEDLDSLLELYLFLHEDCIPEKICILMQHGIKSSMIVITT